jgi:hypothetical protein
MPSSRSEAAPGHKGDRPMIEKGHAAMARLGYYPVLIAGAHAMTREITASGVAISIIFAFFRYAVPVMPKAVAWAGVGAGAIILIAGWVVPEMKITIPVVVLFLVGMLLIGGAIDLALRGASASDANALLPGSNNMGPVTGNKGIVTQDQRGDNAMGTK